VNRALFCFPWFALSRVAGHSRIRSATRPESEYYVNAYAAHYRVPVALVRAVVERESNWRACTVSPERRSRELMQLMPATCSTGSE